MWLEILCVKNKLRQYLRLNILVVVCHVSKQKNTTYIFQSSSCTDTHLAGFLRSSCCTEQFPLLQLLRSQDLQHDRTGKPNL